MTTTTSLLLTGYRSADRSLLTGHRLPGELLGCCPAMVPALARPGQIPVPGGRPDEHLLAARGYGYVRYHRIDWISRWAWLELGPVAERDRDPETLTALLTAAVEHTGRVLDLHRLCGWVTPDAEPPIALLSSAGFEREARVPQALRLGGRPLDREIWGVLLHG